MQTGELKPFTLRIYTKPSCPLCSSLEKKLLGIFDRSAFLASPISAGSLEAVDITSRPGLQERLELQVPVLTYRAAEGEEAEEVRLPHPSPRLTADGLEKFLVKSLHAVQ
ncbi:hypothetical protein ACKKBG_A30330 [Auxenochlorella protothecoides x Auxenochlorella symbiontica]